MIESIDELLTKQFIDGLKKYNLSINEIKDWNFCGGTNKTDLKYFKLVYPNKELPELQKFCLCGHKIKENKYITNGYDIIILGSCCIKKFIPNNKRTCSLCGKNHKRRTSNRCFECSLGICDYCNNKCDEYKSICNPCQYQGRLIILKCNYCKNDFNIRLKKDTELENIDKICNSCLYKRICDKCNEIVYINTVKKENINNGRKFYSCKKCNYFKWID